MSQMVERVARVLASDWADDDWQNLVPDAQRAVRAMTEPTEAMIQAIPGAADPVIAEIIREHWRLMVTAALLPP
jgi:hypothetical protein